MSTGKWRALNLQILLLSLRGLELSLLLGLTTNAPFLLALKLVVEEEQGFFVCLGRPDDGEHTFASIIVRGLGDGDLGTRQATDFGNFGSAATNDAAHHVGGDGDVLSAEVSGRRVG